MGTKQPRWAIFENACANRPKQLGLGITIKRNVREGSKRYASIPDLEIIQFTEYILDCKWTENEFSLDEKRKLILETQDKYGGHLSFCAIICGEKRGKTQFLQKETTICFLNAVSSLDRILTIYPYDDWLKYINSFVNRK